MSTAGLCSEVATVSLEDQRTPGNARRRRRVRNPFGPVKAVQQAELLIPMSNGPYEAMLAASSLMKSLSGRSTPGLYALAVAIIAFADLDAGGHQTQVGEFVANPPSRQPVPPGGAGETVP